MTLETLADFFYDILHDMREAKNDKSNNLDCYFTPVYKPLKNN
jgi:hypothetical protein